MRPADDHFDVIVIGGGPAGSTTAGLLAMRGRKVLLLEREKFPRYHIGESLLTGGLPTLEELGLHERVDRSEFVKKYGGTFRWGAEQEAWDFRFKDASEYEYAYQVRRADFDALLLTRARELGATVLEEATVSAPLSDGDRVTGVEYSLRTAERKYEVTAEYVVDATGQSHLLGRRLGFLDWHDDLRNMAVWTYLQGCERYEGTRAGDVITERRPGGWFWFIPMMDGTTSIGYVTRMPQAAREGTPLSRKELERLYLSEFEQTEEIARLARNARQVSDFRTAKDWSYSCHRMHGPGWAVVGDAAAFIDPLLSTGMTIALRSARGLAHALHWTLAHPADAAAMDRYEHDYQQFVAQLLEFVRYFYDSPRHKEQYFKKAQEIVDPLMRHPRKRDFITLLSGLHGLFVKPYTPESDDPAPDKQATLEGVPE